ncbi:hypothetical protein HKX48_009018 [Thoreauomyces humboldtii]|nr:hypothetical protein HKX48_009018 [Thoreauomyces humboldtii]
MSDLFNKQSHVLRSENNTPSVTHDTLSVGGQDKLHDALMRHLAVPVVPDVGFKVLRNRLRQQELDLSRIAADSETGVFDPMSDLFDKPRPPENNTPSVTYDTLSVGGQDKLHDALMRHLAVQVVPDAAYKALQNACDRLMRHLGVPVVHDVGFKALRNRLQTTPTRTPVDAFRLVARLFAHDENATLLLASSKPSSGGFHFGANRVILFDVGWNPIFENQVIDRIHLLAQEKEFAEKN